jgi:glycosyltransferase involved in cell wall biosynthesis
MWLKIREQLPDATLDIYYGWDSFDKANKGNTERMRWKWGIIKKLHELKAHGVTEHGRVSHEELAQRMKEIQVWAYPTEFTEISCITAMKAQLAGCEPVVNAIAALDETVQFGRKTYLKNIYADDAEQDQFVGEVVAALNGGYDPKPGQEFIRENYLWSNIAEAWSNAMAN